MTDPKKKSKRTANLTPLWLILTLTAAVVVIVFLTQNIKEPTTAPQTVSNEIPVLVGTKQYSNQPPMLIDTNKKYSATFTLEKGGEFVIELYADKAPLTVNNFVFLARDGYFDGVTFHRVLENFMAQTGDPTGTGMGHPGYKFEYEANDLSFNQPGVVAMANSGPQTPTNGSQFFITFVPTPHLDGGYTIFGQVSSGMDVVNGITLRNPQTNPDFEGDKILTVVITEE
jgi:cyclophilin family peptidyl-prolyl cis-trans isomerase